MLKLSEHGMNKGGTVPLSPEGTFPSGGIETFAAHAPKVRGSS